MGLVPNRHLAARSAVSASYMSAAVTAVALLLARPHISLLCRCDYGIDLLPFPLTNLLALLPFLLYRER